MMRLINTIYNLEIELKENQIVILSIESAAAYRTMLFDLWKQYNGDSGSFLLSEDYKELKLQKHLECVYNLYAVNLNEKRIITKLYQELSIQNSEMLQIENTQFRKNLIEYFDRLLKTVPYDLTYNYDFEIESIIKAVDVKIDNTSDTLLERITKYMALMHQICGVSVFVFLNLKYFFNEAELKLLYQTAFYNKIHIIVVESCHSPQITGEKCWIIDKDLCIIEP